MASSSSVLRVAIGSSSLPGANRLGLRRDPAAVAQRTRRRHRLRRSAPWSGRSWCHQSTSVTTTSCASVDETTRQVTRVRGLPARCRRRPFRAPCVGLKYWDVQTLAEVRLDQRLDDRAVRTGHQAAVPAGWRTARPRAPESTMMYSRVHRLLFDRLALRILDLVEPMPFIISAATRSLVRDRMSTTLL